MDYGIPLAKMDVFLFMTSVGFYVTDITEIPHNIDLGCPMTAVIDTEDGLHMVEIVGYYQDYVGINAFQCVNPGNGMYETHYTHEFNEYSNYIFVKY